MDAERRPHWAAYVPGPDKVRSAADGWRESVFIFYNTPQNWGWQTTTPDTLVETWAEQAVARDQGMQFDSVNVEATFDGGAWRDGDQRDALHRLIEDAEGRWPHAAVALLKTWTSETTWPAWEDLVGAVAPHLAPSEIAVWLEVGRTVGWTDFRGRQRSRSWQLDIPDDWRATVHPDYRALMGSDGWLPGWTHQRYDRPLALALSRGARHDESTYLFQHEKESQSELQRSVRNVIADAHKYVQRVFDAVEVWRNHLEAEGMLAPPSPRRWPSPPNQGWRSEGLRDPDSESARSWRSLAMKLNRALDHVALCARAATESGRPPSPTRLKDLVRALDAAGDVYAEAQAAVYR